MAAKETRTPNMTEAEFDVFPPGLRGLNRLAKRLNALLAGKHIADWHLGRWSDRSHTKHGVLFDNDEDAVLARAVATKHEDT